jgi:hypothetical protein
MANKSRVKEQAIKVETPKKAGGNTLRWAATAMLAAGAGFFLYAVLAQRPDGGSVSTRSPGSSSASDPGHAHAAKDPGQTHQFRYFEDPAEAYPLPVTLPPSQFVNKGIANSYRIAKEIPEVLAQQPCLCGCDNTSDDHRSLLDCYVNDHASTCLVCMKEAVLAEQMTDAGKSPKQIREAILAHEFSNVSIGN